MFRAAGGRSPNAGKPAMPSDDTLDFACRTVPSRIAELGFSIDLPRDWPSHEVPPEAPDFDDPTRLVALAVATAPHAAIVLAAAARPAYGDGTLSDWARYLVEQHGLAPRTFGEGRLGTLPALVGEATQDSDLGALLVRFAFAEDGQRLIHLSLTAPALLAGAVLPVWQRALDSFALQTPRGPTVPVYPAPPPVGNHVPLADGAMTAHALAENAASLDPEHPLNASWRERGIGFTPAVVQVDAAAGAALVFSDALRAQLAVPLGWHLLDDGRRLRLLDPDGAVQVSMDLLQSEDGSVERALDAIESQVRADYPAPECLRLADGAIQALGVRNIHDGGEPLEQVHLLVRGPASDLLLRARVTATPERASTAATLGGDLLAHVRFGAGAQRS